MSLQKSLSQENYKSPMVWRQLNVFCWVGYPIQLPRDFMACESQSLIVIVPVYGNNGKGIEGKVFTMQQRNYQRGLSLVGRDTVMNAPVQAIRVQETQRTQFTMVPNILIDGYDELSDAARFGFIKFMRLVRKAGYFAGSIRKLGKKLKVANMTINRMVAAWAKFSLIRVEPIDNTDAVRVIPLTDMLWQANTDHYQYAPAEVREPVTICDTVTVTDRSTTDTVVTICDTVSQNVTQPVTNCDTVSQPQAQNDPQYLYKNIDKNKIEENIS